MRFVLIRHAQSGNNLLYEQTGASTGRLPDPEITDLGHEQTRLLAAELAAGALPWRIDRMYCSLMTRAIQTAVPLADALDLPLHGHAELFEGRGPYDVDPDTGLDVPYPGADRDTLSGHSVRLVLPATAGPDGWWSGQVETDVDVAFRARRLIRGLRAAHDSGDTIALVTHGFFTQHLLREFLGIQRMTGWFDIHNTSITLLEDHPSKPGSAHLVRLDWLPHLASDQVTD